LQTIRLAANGLERFIMAFAEVAGGQRDTRTDDHKKFFYFFHLPKTGGRTIEKHISQRFAPRDVLRPAKHKTFYADCFSRRKYVAARDARDTHIVGHFASWTLLADREQEYYKACFWRHPADWVLSFYNYRHRRNAKALRRPFDFTDFCKSMLRNPMTEHFLLYCGDVPGWTYFFMSDREKFDMAYSLAERFDCFSDISKVDTFINMIGFEQGQRPADYNRVPASQKFLPALDKKARTEIEHTNPVDFYLYRLARGEDRRSIVAEASRTLNPRFDRRDIARLSAVPFYRLKTWVLPFIVGPLGSRTAKLSLVWAFSSWSGDIVGACADLAELSF
jgi:hypothetical protein